MKIEHIAVWSNDIDRLRDFYIKYFDGKSNDKYINKQKQFQSYFISFDDGVRLEIMNKANLANSPIPQNTIGLSHLAFSVGSIKHVNELTKRLESDGYQIVSSPRTTGDGYYESIINDPDGNIIEITI